MGLVGRNFALLAASAAVCALCAASGPAMAQETETAGQPTLLQRLILGFGRPKVATDTPTAVTVIEQDDIDQEIPDTAAELTTKIPGVNAAGSESNVLGQNFNIRGFGPETVGSSQEGRVQVNVDGATKYYESYRMGGLFSDMELYKRVEVLRGPAAGTLYGSGVLGGVINFTTKDASDFLEDGQTAVLRLKFNGDSNQEGYKASAIFASRLGEHAEFIAAGNYTDFKNIITGDDHELLGTGTELPSGLIKGTLYLDEEHEKVLRASYNRTQGDSFSAVSVGGGPVCESFVFPCFPYATPTNTPRLAEREFFDETAVLSYEDSASDNPWLDLKATLSYSKQRNDQGAFVVADMSYAYYEGKLENTAEWTGEKFENFLTVGLQGKYHKRRRNNAASSSHPEYNQHGGGVYAQNEFVWQDRLTLISGMRIDWSTLTPSGTLAEAHPEFEATSGVAYAPKIAALYDLTDSLSVFGSYAYTERLPSGDEEFDYRGDLIQNHLKKERAHSVEIGFGQDLQDVLTGNDALAYKVTAFRNHVTDLIVRNAGGDFENVASANLWGVELEGSYEVEYAFAGLAASVIRGEDADSGEPLNNIAPDEIALTIGGKIPDHYLRFGWDARFVAAQTRVSTASGATPPSDPFNVHDIFASWKPEDGALAGFEVIGRVDNLFDKEYQEYLITSGPSKGRTFKVSVAKTFNF
ncbi:MAG: TonB-dependent receptor [Ahrensia sp.]|nr:TonB-dependent receptor [Ahrensia sp.]